MRHEAERRRVVAGQAHETLGQGGAVAAGAGDIACRILHADDVWNSGKLDHRLSGNLNDATAWYVVEDDGDIDRFGDTGKVTIHTFLCRLVVIGRDRQRR